MNDYIELKKEDLFVGSQLQFPLYFNVAGQYVLYKPNGAQFDQDDLKRIIDNDISILYIPARFEDKYAIYFATNVSKVVTDSSMSIAERSNYLIKSAGHVVKEIFDEPENPQTFIRSQALVRNFVEFIKQGIAAFHSMLSLSIHDYYTYTHSVGVMTYTIALASQLGISARQTLEDLGTAGLFHDIGKTKVPLEIINKPGPLNDEEWNIMKKHSAFSYEIASGYEKLPEVALVAIKQHHENLLGTGYPEGLQGIDINYYSKIVTVCDIYSALTTDRPYSAGRASFEALKIMKSIVDKGQIDKTIFQNLVLMLKG